MGFFKFLGCEPHGGAGVTFGVEVGGMTEDEEEQAYGHYEAGDDHQEGVLDAAYVATGFNSSGLLGWIGLLSFHNLKCYFFRL